MTKFWLAFVLDVAPYPLWIGSKIIERKNLLLGPGALHCYVSSPSHIGAVIILAVFEHHPAVPQHAFSPNIFVESVVMDSTGMCGSETCWGTT